MRREIHTMSGKLLTTKQVQEMLGVSERTIFNFMERGDLKGFKVGRSWRFEESDIEEYINRQRRKSEQKPEESVA
ncbi:MAG TPA: DNA-binding protein [Ktedonobacter sp.]|jgi:excisionase family DNA binding protein|nr:DNA-binding protein [Ktedonobacter sp.]HAT44616.1 DNA-binding protein [Ktedonobacter sp.]HBE24704.1 DNA-binding protein [Ktedonobacter sp.]HCJ36423.1 DNA-binding protein [Ktedonobacter sp.]HCP73554.1 DNA-binding protein [Ktedonobacter sp.]